MSPTARGPHGARGAFPSSPWPGRVFDGALIVYLALLAVGVLSPMRESALPWVPVTDGWLADMGRNVVLFAPLGLALGRTTDRLVRVALFAFALSVAIEVAQLWIPGRHPSPLDLVSNTAGGILGSALPGLVARARRWHLCRPGELSMACSVAGAMVVVASSFLLAATFPEAVYYGGWTPELPDMGVYSGSVVRAAVGDVAIVAWGPAPDGERLRRALVEGRPIEIEAIVGEPPLRRAPVVTVADGVPREMIMLSVDGRDLVYVERTRAVAIGLHAPRFEIVDALAGLEPGTAFRVRIERSSPDLEIALDRGPPVHHETGPGRTWSLWLPSWIVARPLRPWLDAAWILALVLPAAWFAAGSRRAWSSVLALCVIVLLLPRLGPLNACRTPEIAALSLALALGAARSWTGSRSAVSIVTQRDTPAP